MLLVIEPVRDAHRTPLHTVRLESKRLIQTLCTWIFGVHGQIDLQHVGIASVGNSPLKQHARHTTSAPLRIDKDSPQNGLVSNLHEWLAPQTHDADQA